MFISKKTSMQVCEKMSSLSEARKYQFLVKLVFENGAVDAKIIPASKVVVEDRVVLKCKVGCNYHGKTLACPPYTPSFEQFRKIQRIRLRHVHEI
jgi:predicted metal-binding protein